MKNRPNFKSKKEYIVIFLLFLFLIFLGISRHSSLILLIGLAVGIGEATKIIMKPGDLLILFSDGITEAMNNQNKEFSEEKLMAVVRNNKDTSPDLFIDEIVAAVKEHSGATPQWDDMTLMIIKRDAE